CSRSSRPRQARRWRRTAEGSWTAYVTPSPGATPDRAAAPAREAPADEATADEGTAADGSWLELSVLADPEAVEAVSEILSRFAPGGTRGGPPFELTSQGPGASMLAPSRCG